MRLLVGGTAVAVGLFAAVMALSAEGHDPQKQEAIAAAGGALSQDCSDSRYQAERAALKTVEIKEGGATRIYYVFQGDMLVAGNGLRDLWMRSCHRTKGPTATEGGKSIELKVMLDERGNRAIWSAGARKLTYAVDRSSFAPQGELQYRQAVDAIKAAAKDWQEACPQCGIELKHRADLDRANPRIAAGVPKAGEVTFVVSYLRNPSDSGLIASAFFPNDPLFRRRLYITPAFYSSSFLREGVVRHELGHVLGYRHEHVGITGCPSEDFNWEALGSYTKNSVMHYPCAGGGSQNLAIVDEDKRQHRLAYSGS